MSNKPILDTNLFFSSYPFIFPRNLFIPFQDIEKKQKKSKTSFLLLIDETANLLPQRLEETKKCRLKLISSWRRGIFLYPVNYFAAQISKL